MQYNITQTSL